jgi:hypothetical protein
MRLKLVVGSVLLAILMMAVPNTLHAQVHVGVAIAVAPPPIPVYDQPVCPGDGYFWTPGYWDYDYDAGDYFWVPGTWVEPPEVGFLWTPGWWGWGGSGFLWNAGFWGPTVGFYGGINYGFGWFGTGFYGGRWEGGHFFYNTDVWHVGGGFHNVYNEHVDIHNDVHVSYNGHGGVDARATAQEEAAARERHVGPVAAQTQFRETARNDPQQRFSNNHGRPATVATARASDFHGNAGARGNEAGGRPAENGARNETNARTENGGSKTYTHPNDLPAAERPAAPNTGNAKQDKKYQQQQENLYNKQTQERQKLQSQQDKEHQQAQKQSANQQKQEQMEQRHSQQTQQLQQRHAQQTQQLQSRQAPPASHAASGGGAKPK